MRSLILPIVFCIFTVTFSVPGFTQSEDSKKQNHKKSPCVLSLVGSKYEVSDTFMQKIKPTFVAESGSIENKNPGLIRQLLKIRVAILELYKTYRFEFSKAYNESVKEALSSGKEKATRSDIHLMDRNSVHALLVEGLNVFIRDLKILGSKSEIDPRFPPLLKNVVGYAQKLLQEEIRQPGKPDLEGGMRLITSTMWEMIVACLFDGKEIFLNRKVSELYPSEFAALKFTRAERPKYDRELDITILNDDGSWRWIEVKDWSPENTRNAERLVTLAPQSIAQDNVRKLLSNVRIQLDLMLKFGFSEEDYQLYGRAAKYDHIYYVFPYGIDADTSINLGNLRAF